MHTRAVEQEQIPALLALGVGLIPYSPLNTGQLDAYEQLCREVGGSLPRCDRLLLQTLSSPPRSSG